MRGEGVSVSFAETMSTFKGWKVLLNHKDSWNR